MLKEPRFWKVWPSMKLTVPETALPIIRTSCSEPLSAAAGGESGPPTASRPAAARAHSSTLRGFVREIDMFVPSDVTGG
jgi:hypothetical protein